MPAKYVPGVRVGRLVVLRREGGRVVCRCDCGTVRSFHSTTLSHAVAGRRGGSCGCLYREHVERLSRTSIAGRARAAGVPRSRVAGRMGRGESFDAALIGERRGGRVVTSTDGITATLSEHARRIGVTKQAIHERMRTGMTPVEAVSAPRVAEPGRGRRRAV